MLLKNAVKYKIVALIRCFNGKFYLISQPLQ